MVFQLFNWYMVPYSLEKWTNTQFRNILLLNLFSSSISSKFWLPRDWNVIIGIGDIFACGYSDSATHSKCFLLSHLAYRVIIWSLFRVCYIGVDVQTECSKIISHFLNIGNYKSEHIFISKTSASSCRKCQWYQYITRDALGDTSTI